MPDNITEEQVKSELFDYFGIDKSYDASPFDLWLVSVCRKGDIIEKALTEVCQKYHIKLKVENNQIAIYQVEGDRESLFFALDEIG